MARIGIVFLILVHTTVAYRPILRKLSANETTNFTSSYSLDPNVHSTYLDNDKKYLLRWEYDNETITFNITVEAVEWVGLGFSPNGGMAGADIAMVWFDKDGIPRITDRHADRNQYPIKDVNEDYELLAASRNGTHIMASIRRSRNTCDDKEDYRLTSDSTRLIYAFSSAPISQQAADGGENLKQHAPTDRGTKGLFLFEPPDIRPELPEDTITLDILADNVSVPHDYHLTYWCQIFELPALPVHHLIRFEPLLDKENEQYVHHLAAYQCTGNMSAYLYKGGRCFMRDGGNYSDMYTCSSRPMWFWVLGMGSTDFPKDVGFPMFESDEDKYVMLEIHYENIELRQDLVDNSGIRMLLTPTPRPIEAGVMAIAGVEQAVNQIMPPGEAEFRFYAHASNCLRYLPRNGVEVFNVLLHAHLRGKKIRTHHYRGGVQLPDFATNDKYDFYYQNFRRLDPPRRILPGDDMVLEAIYDTSKDNKTVFGGFSTLDEMISYTGYYYPRFARGFVCFSYPDPQEYVPIFGGQLSHDNETVVLPSKENVSLEQFVRHHLDWEKPGVRKKYSDLVANGRYLQQLHLHMINEISSNASSLENDSDSSVHQMVQEGYPKVSVPWRPEKEVMCPLVTRMNASTTESPKPMSQGAHVIFAYYGLCIFCALVSVFLV